MASMFPDASNIAIAGGSFTILNQTNNTQTTVHTPALDKLAAAAAHGALHNAPARTDETRCHQRTRTNLLDHLERWAQGICDEAASIIWLHGGAGAGKSAVMQTLAERCAAQTLALGSFFFFRGDPTRNTAEVLIPTLVYQLAQLFPSSMDVLGPIMDRDPLIFKKAFQVQILSLFVPVLQHLVELGSISNAPQSPRVFLIDGLDECGDAAQQRAIIHAVATVCHEHRIPVKLLIASRPELAISTSFEWFSRENLVLGAISLSEDADAEEDVRRFIEDEFLKIRLQHPFRKMIPSEWPHDRDIQTLVWKSSSHFIYASTAMKYIWSAKENPARSLQVILGLEVSRTISPFSELDTLYHHIIGAAAHCDKVLEILAYCLYLSGLSLEAGMISLVLDCSKDDLLLFVADISPLLAIIQSYYYEDMEELKLLHASLGDFLEDQSRSGPLHVNKQIYLASKLKRCFQLLDLCSQQQLTTPDWETAGSDYRRLYRSRTSLSDQIISTIGISGHLLVTEEVLSQYSLCDFYRWQLRFKPDYYDGQTAGPYFHQFLPQFLMAVHQMETPNAPRLLQSVAQEFFDILELYVNLESTLLAPAIVTLAFSGYSPRVVDLILQSHFCNSTFRVLLNYDNILDIMAMADPASVHHSTNTSPKRLAAAAEAMLEYLTDKVNLQFLSMHSTHKSWLQRTKPGKHISTGTPRLASSFDSDKVWSGSLRLLEHRQYLNSLADVDEDNDTLFFNERLSPKVLGPKYCTLDELIEMERKITTVASLLEALLWLLPKVGLSEKLVLLSKKTFPWKVYERNVGLCRRVCKGLDKYANRVQKAKLEELGQRIANGDANALIEKSRMLYLDAQD